MKITLIDFNISDDFDNKYIEYRFRYFKNNSKIIETLNLVIPKDNNIIKCFVQFIFKYYNYTQNILYYKNKKYIINNDKIINCIEMY